ncbi:Trp biosynthesis-associated membrane protein [Frankia sp. Cppng1_Ct_nod]|uniref:Trp biosynthesis-associated membrane protein n=1 Tax=Frankia sp. Cppng1_Ct_nod TaxID=2897162 RepID=UPI001F5E5287|nr:Trp biosynthesis-associated membrane protein [Frankia sp. Cppng1_Ct_nod]
MTGAVACCLVGAVLVLVVAGTTWVRLRVADGSVPGDAAVTAAPLAVSLSGSDLAPAVTGLGLVGLAGVAAIAATRRFGRVLVGLLMLAAGVAVAVVAGRIAADPLMAVRAASQVRQIVPGVVVDLIDPRRTAGPWLAASGGVLLALGGMVVMIRGYAWSALSARYQAPASRPVDAWEAIDRGDDPT